MAKSETQVKNGDKRPPPPPPPGYPTENPEKTKKSCCIRMKKKGDRGFIEGCLFALCCCWLCEECCFF